MSGGDDPGSPAASSPIYFFFLLLLLLPISVFSNDKCYSFRCANSNVEIGYPLWNSSEANTRYCGYPNLGVECRDGYPVLELGDDSYRIADVRYNTSTITLQDIDLLGRECPRARHNLTLANSVPLQRTETDAHLLFFFNCSDVQFLGNYQLLCLSQNSGVNRYSYVFQEGSVPPASYPWGRCQDFVVATVLEALLPSSPNELLSSFGRVLNQGFELTWSPSDMADCKSCENDGGNCGYKNKGDSRGYEFVCRSKASEELTSSQKTKKRIIIFGTIAGASGFLIACITLYCWCYQKHCNLSPIWLMKSRNPHDIEVFLEQYGSTIPKRYRYAEVKKITKSFIDKLGQGGYGIVFKGKLQDGRLVAVKVLKKSKENAEEFINEVASIGRTHHVNIVNLLGFCCEGSKRALIYEFMPNGSLEKFVFLRQSRNVTLLSWKKLLEIAIGIARGLEYLHRGCNTHIVHFDIKPHNILLDEDFCPKISDFGLAKSCRPKHSILSTVGTRGTIGYIAPEVFSRSFGMISSKSDVYSYGMMVLEMVGGRKNSEVEIDNSSDAYFPHWIYEHFNDNDAFQLCGIIDETEEVARKMVLVGLWCIQTSPSSRPTMSNVLEMLEGNLKDVQMPPKPYLFSP